jgi:hypothetical protein
VNWCIVSYVGATPFFYCGYYVLDPDDNMVKPMLSSSFDYALKTTKECAGMIYQAMGAESKGWKVEEHTT